MSTPLRPRLAPWVRPRLHHFRESGSHASHVVLHDARTHESVHLETRLFSIVALADGTRDFDALTLAAERDGLLQRRSELRALLDQLSARGLLVDGIANPGESPVPPDPADQSQRPLDVLPIHLACDGRGGCCRQYPSIAFSDAEATRARVHAPAVLDGLADRRRVFLPLSGNTREAHGVAFVDGACAYLADADAEGARACVIHPVRPLGCQLYPATLVDDGEAIRVSVKVECDCVARSVGLPPEKGEPLVAREVKHRGDLPAGLDVVTLPARITLDETTEISRAEWLLRRARLLDLLVTDGARIDDVAAMACTFADAVRSLGTRPQLPKSAAPSFASLESSINALAARTQAMSEAAIAWRSPRDRARRLRLLCAEAAARLLGTKKLPPPRDHQRALEVFHLRAALYGHQLVFGTLATELRALAVRVYVARMIDDESEGAPLTLVEATMRIADGRD